MLMLFRFTILLTKKKLLTPQTLQKDGISPEVALEQVLTDY